MYPYKLIPPLKDYLWGGTRLKEEYGMQSDLGKVAEAWVLSCHKDGQSVVANGSDAGMALADIIARDGAKLLGSHMQDGGQFPILIKLIDAKDNLSVQVHPDDAYAYANEGEAGKTEAWYVLACEPGAQLIYGFRKEISKEEFQQRITDNTLLEVVNQVPVHKGDLFFIEAGTLHAIGKGILLAEVQQNSNSTYRVYDYGRVGADGKPRDLHIDKALAVTKRTPPTHAIGSCGAQAQFEGYSETPLVDCELFHTSALCVQSHRPGEVTPDSFLHLLILEGSGILSWSDGSMQLAKGESIFLPAGFGRYALAGNMEVLATSV